MTLPGVSSIKARGKDLREGIGLVDRDLEDLGEPLMGSSGDEEEEAEEGVPGEGEGSAERDSPLTDHDRVLLVLAYLGILALVPYLTARKAFVIWHARQGLLLCAVSLVSLLGMILANVVLWSFSWVLGLLFLIIFLTSLFGFLALVVTCILKALEGERWRIPYLGDFVDRA